MIDIPVRVYARTDTGRVRDNNEDYFDFREPADERQRREDGCLYVVADGVGGSAEGEIASRRAVETALRHYYEETSGPDAAQRLVEAVKAANLEIYQLVQSGEHLKMGTTLVMAALLGNQFTVAHVGDSRAYLVRGDHISQLTEDHSLVWRLYREGTITHQEMLEHPKRNLLLRSLGHTEDVEVDTTQGELQLGDALLLCSDGLTTYLSDDEIAGVVRTMPGQAAVDRLIEMANQRGGKDNITVLIMRAEEPSPESDAEAETVLMEPISAPEVETVIVERPTAPADEAALTDEPSAPEAEIVNLEGEPAPADETLPSRTQRTLPRATRIRRQPRSGLSPLLLVAGALVVVILIALAATMVMMARGRSRAVPAQTATPLLGGGPTVDLAQSPPAAPPPDISPPTEMPQDQPVLPTPSPEVPEGMLLVPAGQFIYGRTEEQARAASEACAEATGDDTLCDLGNFTDSTPRETPDIPAFYIDRTEASVADYMACVEAGACREPLVEPEPDDYLTSPQYQTYPMRWLSWQAAQAYCAWAGKRLPTQQEWEKAARGTDGRLYPWGDDWNETNAVYQGNVQMAGPYPIPDPVDAYPVGASPCGALNMAGNLLEWTADENVARGGSYMDLPEYLQAPHIFDTFIEGQGLAINGVRCAMDAH
jgi:serine/threonine protein phosphatase PrpC/formylglycine-generating enzyme required for sulfatase activity